MTFAHPLVLLGLLGLPVLAAAYVREQRARAAARRAFVAPRLTRSVTPRHPGWRRHAPVAMLALAVAALVIAAAQPQHRVLVPVKSATVMLANDISASMQATDVKPSRLAAAQAAAGRFVAEAPHRIRIGQIEFARQPTLLQSPTNDHVLVRQAIGQLRPGGGGTAIGPAIQIGLTAIAGVPKVNGKRPPGAIVLLSDGAANVGLSPLRAAAAARQQHVRIYTIAIGTPGGVIAGRHGQRVSVPVSSGQLRAIATASGGVAYTAADSNRAAAIYSHLARTLGHTHAEKSLIAGLAGLALGLLLIGSALSLLWFARLA